jgi:hypothetical protein
MVLGLSPHIDANSLFFASLKLFSKMLGQVEGVLNLMVALVSVAIAYLFRHRVMMLLGFDQQLFRADLADVLTCFSMKRFCVMEVALLRVEGLAPSYTARSLFIRMILGYNEPQHTRPRDGCTHSMNLRERLHLNYDPEDDTETLSIVVKEQEMFGGAIAQTAPAAGAIVGALGGVVSPLGPGPGAAAGIIMGTGAANSLGVEVARVDLSAAQVNFLMDKQPAQGKLASAPAVPWRQENFSAVDLVPQGRLWLRISMAQEP